MRALAMLLSSELLRGNSPDGSCVEGLPAAPRGRLSDVAWSGDARQDNTQRAERDNQRGGRPASRCTLLES